jgi:signal transduction histidine kinase/putative methionine-R-sulfoxide reductase with GAF domain
MLREARNELLSTMLRNLALVGSLGVISAWFATGAGPQRLVNVGLVFLAVILVFALARARSLPLEWRGGTLIALGFAVAVASLLNNGLTGSGRLYFLAVPVMAAILFGRRIGSIIVLLAIGVFLLISTLFANGLLRPNYIPSNESIADWVSAGVTLMVVTVGLIPALQSLVESQVVQILTARQNETLARSQMSLLAQTDDLEQAKQQLTEANTRLVEQSTALERRASQLAVSAEVARIAASLHNVPELLDTTAQLISERFGYYQTGIFLIDESGDWAVLRAASSAGGRKMLARGHRLRVGQQGIVGYVTGKGEPRVAAQVSADQHHAKTAELPETQSEAAVSMRIRSRVIGAIDVQSTAPDAIQADDVLALQTLADQLAVAIDNARLFQSTERQLTELREIQQERVATQLQNTTSLAYRYDGVEVEPVAGSEPDPNEPAVRVPIEIGQNTLGVLEVAVDTGGLTDSQRQLAEAIAERMGLALENAQLFREAQNNARRMQALSSATLSLAGPQASPEQLTAEIAQLALTLTEADGAAVWLTQPYDPEQITLAHQINLPTSLYLGASLRAGEGLAGHVLASGEPLRVDDYSLWPGRAPHLADLPLRAGLAVPLRWREVTLGVLNLYRITDTRPFARDDETLVRLFAVAAASALRNTQLITEANQRIQNLEAVNTISAALREGLSLDSTLARVGDLLRVAFKAETASIALYDADQEIFAFPYFVGPGIDEPPPPQRLGVGVTTAVIKSRKPLLLNRNIRGQMAELDAKLVGDAPLSYLGVPIIVGPDVKGVISVQSTSHEEAFDEADSRLLAIIANSVGVTIENARLFENTVRAREEAESLYAASAALNTTGKYHEILAVLRAHSVLADAAQLSINVFEEPVPLNADPQSSEPIARWPHEQADSNRQLLPLAPWMQRLLKHDAPVAIEDTAEHPGLDATARAWLTLRHNARSALYVPLNVTGEWIGYLSALYTEPTRFGEADVRRVMSLTSQAAVLVENMRAAELIERRADQLTTAADVSRAATSIMRQEQLIVEATDLIRERFGMYYVALFLVDTDRRWAVIKHAAGEHGRSLIEEGHRLEIGGQSMIGQALALRETRWTNDVRHEPIRYPNPRLTETRSEAALPLVIGDEAIGALSVQSTRNNAFNQKELEVLRSMADQLAIAIRNAQLVEDIERRARQQSQAADIGRSVSALLQETELLKAATGLTCERLGLRTAALYLVDDTQRAGFDGERAGAEERARLRQLAGELAGLPAEISLAPEPVAASESISPPDQADHTPLAVIRAALMQRQTSQQHDLVVLPMISAGAVLGGLVVRTTYSPSESDAAILQTLADQISASLQNARLYAREQEANEQLREVDRLKTQFLANMSHELRTPLNSIIGFSRVILKGIDGPLTEEQRTDLTAIHTSGRLLLDLINDILDLSRIEAGKMDLMLEPTSLPDLFEGVMMTAKGLAKEKAIDLIKDLPADLPQVKADSMRLRQVVLNLISNAVKFTEKGSVTLRARPHTAEDGSAWVQISVIDTGIGLTQADMRKLFERFSQVDDSTTRKQGGSGLGLHISRQLIDMHNGRIWVESAGVPGQGSTFHVMVPAVLETQLSYEL